MQKVRDYLLRWRLLQCLCLLLAFSIILSNTSIESKASESENVVYTSEEFTSPFVGSMVQSLMNAQTVVDIDNSLYDFSLDKNYRIDFIFDKVSLSTMNATCTSWSVDINLLGKIFSFNSEQTDVVISKTFNGSDLPSKVIIDYAVNGFNATNTYMNWCYPSLLHAKYSIVELADNVNDTGSDNTDSGGTSSTTSNRIYEVEDYTHISTDYLTPTAVTRPVSFVIPLSYTFDTQASYRISFIFETDTVYRDLYNVAATPVQLSQNWILKLGGIEFTVNPTQKYHMFDFSPLSSSLVGEMEFTGDVGGWFLPSDYTLSSSCVADTSIYVKDIVFTKTSARTTNEILEDMESQDKITQDIVKDQLEEQQEQTETQKGIWQSIKDFFGSFFQNLIDSIIHVIVPTTEEMGDLFNRLNDFFADTFGFLYYPFDFIIDAFNIFLEADSETGLTFPGFSIMGYEVWSDMTYDITSEPIVGTIFGYVRMGTGAMLAMWFVNYLRNFFDKRFGGGGN